MPTTCICSIGRPPAHPSAPPSSRNADRANGESPPASAARVAGAQAGVIIPRARIPTRPDRIIRPRWVTLCGGSRASGGARASRRRRPVCLSSVWCQWGGAEPDGCGARADAGTRRDVVFLLRSARRGVAEAAGAAQRARAGGRSCDQAEWMRECAALYGRPLRVVRGVGGYGGG